MLYNITGNSLLSPAAKLLDPAALDAYATVAESVLRLDTVALFTVAGDVTKVKNALAFQVNRILELGGDTALLKSWSNGQRSETFRDGLPLLSELAETLVQSLTGAPAGRGGNFAPFKGFRPTTTDAPEVGFFPF
jgi:hypothetical protein